MAFPSKAQESPTTAFSKQAVVQLRKIKLSPTPMGSFTFHTGTYSGSGNRWATQSMFGVSVSQVRKVKLWAGGAKDSDTRQRKPLFPASFLPPHPNPSKVIVFACDTTESDLDANHVVPNMRPMQHVGVWFPNHMF